METSVRLLRLLALLQSRPSWPGGTLAERVGVTPRTLRRDVARLRELGYPVEATPGRYGGYRLVAGGAMPPLVLEDEEAVAVALGLRAAAGTMPGVEDHALLALAKIEQVLPARLRERIREVAEATVRLGGIATPYPGVQVATLVVLARARQGSERVRFVYRDGSGRESERHIDPYQLVHAGRRWYLVAWDRDREDWRSFRVDRMSQVKPTGMRFSVRPSPDAGALVAEGVAVRAYRLHALVLLELPLDEARLLVPPTVAILEADGDRTRLRIGADEPEWIAHFLAGLPCPFVVEEPEEVRRAVDELGARLRAFARPAAGG